MQIDILSLNTPVFNSQETQQNAVTRSSDFLRRRMTPICLSFHAHFYLSTRI